MPIPATNIKTISKIDSFRFIKFSFSACFCSVVIILYFTIYRNCVPQSQFVKIVCNVKNILRPSVTLWWFATFIKFDLTYNLHRWRRVEAVLAYTNAVRNTATLIIHYSLNKAKIERGCVAASPENYIYHRF